MNKNRNTTKSIGSPRRLLNDSWTVVYKCVHTGQEVEFHVLRGTEKDGYDFRMLLRIAHDLLARSYSFLEFSIYYFGL